MTPDFMRPEKIKELEREVAMRQRVYAHRVRSGAMTPAQASRGIRIMQEILNDYRREGDLFAMEGGPYVPNR